MARIFGAWGTAWIAARNNWTGAQFIRYLRQNDMGSRESEARALLKIARQGLKNNPDEPFANPNEVPDLTTAAPWATQSATGVSQRVELTYRVKSTGTLITVPYAVSSESGVTRAEAIAKAIEAYAGSAEQYQQELVGAVHTKTFVLTPAVTTGD